eukprot:TRINITY_DN1272_c0_g1_i3.p1 TRINITY_DN1272_c0_g1~~TRINITY_DN1272_c0_g1_i3.p1  ORF type:complete len:406 (-),score=25.98 TRINITY_DN1272_c0_g1_i3:172-1389(-)
MLTKINKVSEDGNLPIYIVPKSKGRISRSKRRNSKACNGTCDPGAWNKQSFSTRKPGIVVYIPNATGSLSITSYGDVKPRGEGNFADADIGQVLDMASIFLWEVQPHRPFVYTYLTDSYRWVFFKVLKSRKGGSIEVEQSKVFIGYDGWRQFLGLLTCEPQQVGYCDLPEVPGVEISRALGSGGFCTAFQGVYEGEDVVVKLFDKENKDALVHCDAERFALERLQGSELDVPQIRFIEQATLVVAPVGEIVRPLAGGCVVSMTALAGLVRTVERAHNLELEHRDIKPDNIYMLRDGSRRLLLNDWGGCKIRDDTRVAVHERLSGADGYRVPEDDEVSQDEEKWRARDLVALVYTCFSIHTGISLYLGRECWNSAKGGFWASLEAAARAEDYDQMCSLLKGNHEQR